MYIHAVVRIKNTDHVLINRRRYSSILDVQSFRKADCDTDNYLVIAKIRHRLAISKRAAQKMDRDIQSQEVK
jgi:hypothetical protein